MTTTNTHTVNFDQPIEKIYAAYTDAGFWEKFANLFPAAKGEVEKFESTDAGTTVVVAQTVASDKIPSAAQKFIKSGVGMKQTFVISPLADGSAHTTLTTDISGVPVTFGATQELVAQGDGCVLTTTSEFNVKIPLVGGKLEEKGAPQLERVLDAETALLADYAK